MYITKVSHENGAGTDVVTESNNRQTNYDNEDTNNTLPSLINSNAVGLASPENPIIVAPVTKKKKKKKKAQEPVEVEPPKPPRIVFNIHNTIYDVIKEVAKRDFNWKISHKDPWNTYIEWDIQWADVAPMLEKWKEMKPFQKINHFPGMYQIARKNYLARNLNKMQKQFPGDYKFFPKTWLLPH